MAQRLQLLAHGAGERLVLVQVPDLLPSEALPPAPDPAAPRQRSLRREDLPPAAAAQGLKALPSGKACPLPATCLHCPFSIQHQAYLHGAKNHRWKGVPAKDFFGGLRHSPVTIFLHWESWAHGIRGRRVFWGCSCVEVSCACVQIGQLVVYESGTVKLQIGSVLYDLEPGISPNIREEIAGITSLGEEPACPLLGEVQQHAVITPDMDHLIRCIEFRPAAGQDTCIADVLRSAASL